MFTHQRPVVSDWALGLEVGSAGLSVYGTWAGTHNWAGGWNSWNSSSSYCAVHVLQQGGGVLTVAFRLQRGGVTGLNLVYGSLVGEHLARFLQHPNW